jgi:hypothetical protein
MRAPRRRTWRCGGALLTNSYDYGAWSRSALTGRKGVSLHASTPRCTQAAVAVMATTPSQSYLDTDPKENKKDKKKTRAGLQRCTIAIARSRQITVLSLARTHTFLSHKFLRLFGVPMIPFCFPAPSLAPTRHIGMHIPLGHHASTAPLYRVVEE